MRCALLIGALALAACSEEQPTPKAPVEVAAAQAPRSDAVATPTIELTEAAVRRVCRAAIAHVQGQRPADVAIDGLQGRVVTLSWRAPVDGGRARAQCRTDKDIVAWKPLDRPVAEQNRWMTEPGDPVLRFRIDDQAVTIDTTLPDGATGSDRYEIGQG